MWAIDSRARCGARPGWISTPVFADHPQRNTTGKSRRERVVNVDGARGNPVLMLTSSKVRRISASAGKFAGPQAGRIPAREMTQTGMR